MHRTRSMRHVPKICLQPRIFRLRKFLYNPRSVIHHSPAVVVSCSIFGLYDIRTANPQFQKYDQIKQHQHNKPGNDDKRAKTGVEYYALRGKLILQFKNNIFVNRKYPFSWYILEKPDTENYKGKEHILTFLVPRLRGILKLIGRNENGRLL